MTYLVGEKLLALIRALERDRRLAPEVEDFAEAIKTVFTPAELREYLRRARPRRAPGPPTTDLRYLPEEALFVAHMKSLLLPTQRPARSTG